MIRRGLRGKADVEQRNGADDGAVKLLLLVPVAVARPVIGFDGDTGLSATAVARSSRFGSTAVTRRGVLRVIVVMVVVMAVPVVFEQIGQPAAVVGVDVRVLAAGVLVVEHAGARHGDVEKEQCRYREREARVLYGSARHG